MYRVAVIENETELQRYGHANVVRNLKNAIVDNVDRTSYEFISFTSDNILELFVDNSTFLMSFDALFLSTNACSDRVVSNVLHQNKQSIISYIEAGKGIYVGYQKKYSSLHDEKDNVQFDFLPLNYQFHSCEEFLEDSLTGKKVKKKSSDGGIIFDEHNFTDVLLTYPNILTEQCILERCRKNEFQNHLYKSSIYPIYTGVYEALIIDKVLEAGEEKDRILLARAMPKTTERIVISTMAIDWENHSELLENILEYIVKGVPQLAFITGKTSPSNDFNFLITSAKIAKMPYVIYKDIDEISGERLNMHNCFFFAPSINDFDVNQFWKKIRLLIDSKKIYHLCEVSDNDVNNDLILKQYSNSSSVDIIKERVSMWLMIQNSSTVLQQTKSTGGFFDGGFWVTYDALHMIKDAQIDYEMYLEGIESDLKKHIQDGSYDRLIGCTLGMLELLKMFWPDRDDDISIIKTKKWIQKTIFQQDKEDQMPISLFEKESFLLTYSRLFPLSDVTVWTKEMKNLIDEVYGRYVCANTFDCSETELCRHFEFCKSFNKSYEKILKEIMQRQENDGKWVNVCKTGTVLISLMKNLNPHEIVSLGIKNQIESGINYLRAQYDENKNCWNDRILDTVKAMHALYLFNDKFSFVSNDFFESAKRDVDVAGYNLFIEHTLNTTAMLRSRLQKNEKILVSKEEEIENLTNSLKEINDTLKKNQLEFEDDRKVFEKRWRKATLLWIFFASLMVSIVTWVWIELDAFMQLITQIGSMIALVVSVFVSIFVESLIHRNLFTKNKDKKRMLKK